MPADLGTRVLYHYTTAAGLLGILSSGYLRGTNASFLNDTSEITLGHSMCKTVLEEERSERSNELEKKLLERAIGWIDDDTPPSEVYVSSFSARRDVLGQWRGYGSGDGRFCVGFEMSQFSERDVLRFPQRVEYAPTEQRNTVRRAVAIACETLLEAPEDSHPAHTCAVGLAMHLRRLMCSFKHAGFAEEEEWRSITTVSQPHELATVGFDVSRGLLRPYVAMLAGSRVSGRLPIVEVCVGYAERKSATVAAARLLLSRHGYDDARITTTDIPFVG